MPKDHQPVTAARLEGGEGFERIRRSVLHPDAGWKIGMAQIGTQMHPDQIGGLKPVQQHPTLDLAVAGTVRHGLIEALQAIVVPGPLLDSVRHARSLLRVSISFSPLPSSVRSISASTSKRSRSDRSNL